MLGIFFRDVARPLQVLHSTEFQDVKMAEGKRVVVVGNGKSAVDCAVEASKAPGRGKRNLGSGSSTHVFRSTPGIPKKKDVQNAKNDLKQ